MNFNLMCSNQQKAKNKQKIMSNLMFFGIKNVQSGGTP